MTPMLFQQVDRRDLRKVNDLPSFARKGSVKMRYPPWSPDITANRPVKTRFLPEEVYNNQVVPDRGA